MERAAEEMILTLKVPMLRKRGLRWNLRRAGLGYDSRGKGARKKL